MRFIASKLGVMAGTVTHHFFVPPLNWQVQSITPIPLIAIE